MFLDNKLFILLMIFIGILLANIVLLELGKIFGSKKKSKSSDGKTTRSRRSLALAIFFYFLLFVIDTVFVVWLLTTGKNDIIELLDLDDISFFSF